MAWQEASEATERAAKASTRPVGRLWQRKAAYQHFGADRCLTTPTGCLAPFFKPQITSDRPPAPSPKVGTNRGSPLLIAENLGASGPLMTADNTPRKQEGLH